MTRPLLFVVTGPPASGKTSVAEELAKRLGVPFFPKETFKEALYDTFGSGEELEERIDAAALAILFSVVDRQLAEGVSVTAESNFDAETDVAPFRRFAEEHDAEVVQDPTDADELRAKLRAGHWEPLALPGLLVEADMHDEEEAIVDRVRAALDC